MTAIASRHTTQLDDAARERTVRAVFACGALACGVVAALGSAQWLAVAIVLFFIFVAAMTLPLIWVAMVLAALVPFQFYLEIPDSSFTLRAAAVFVFAIVLRVLARRSDRQDLARWRVWVLPAALFLLAVLVAAIGAQSRYLALRGIYDWLVIFATAFVVGEFVRSRQVMERLVLVLIAGGVAQALIGLLQYALGLESVLGVLRMPISELFFQPNLLRERLIDTSFNWIVFDRASPFGTFINGIDYAIFLAAILGLTLPMLFAARSRGHFAMFFGAALAMGSALLLTFKGSGLIAFAGGAVIVALFSLRPLSPRTLMIGLLVVAVGLVLALPFADQIAQRAVFLLQREQGVTGTAGRLEIWASLLQQFAQRPIFGYGLNHAALLTEATRTLNGGAVALINPAAENAYVAALVETGIVGFAALIALFGVTLVRAAQRARGDALFVGVFAALVALLLGNLTVAGFTTDQNGMLLGILIGMIFGRWNPL